MQAQFAQDNNPDAQTLQKLAERTGLSRRVIQVIILKVNQEMLKVLGHFSFPPFGIWFISLSIMFIQVVTCISTSFLFMVG